MPFNGLACSQVVISGALRKLEVNSIINVYSLMLAQLVRDCSGLPDPRTLKLSEIKWFYSFMINELLETTKPRT